MTRKIEFKLYNIEIKKVQTVILQNESYYFKKILLDYWLKLTRDRLRYFEVMGVIKTIKRVSVPNDKKYREEVKALLESRRGIIAALKKLKAEKFK